MLFLNGFHNKEIYLFYIFTLIKEIFTDEFLQIKKLSLSDNYFVVLDSGLYLYNFNNYDCSIIQSFSSSIYKTTENNIYLTELHNKQYSYMFCFTNEYFFAFNGRNNKTISYKLFDYEVNILS